MDKEKVYLRSKDVAHVLDCSPDDVYDVISKGGMPAIKRGRYWFFRYEDVMACKKRSEKNAS